MLSRQDVCENGYTYVPLKRPKSSLIILFKFVEVTDIDLLDAVASTRNASPDLHFKNQSRALPKSSLESITVKNNAQTGWKCNFNKFQKGTILIIIIVCMQLHKFFKFENFRSH